MRVVFGCPYSYSSSAYMDNWCRARQGSGYYVVPNNTSLRCILTTSEIKPKCLNTIGGCWNTSKSSSLLKASSKVWITEEWKDRISSFRCSLEKK